MKALNKTISCINQLYLRNINMMKQTTRIYNASEKTHFQKTRGGSEPLKSNLGPSSHASEQSNRM